MKKTVLVTGGNRGIGFEIAKGLAKLNYRVLLAARTLDRAQDAVHKLNLENVFPVTLDLTEIEEIGKQFDEIVRAFGAPDILINNAGILVSDSLKDLTIKAMSQSFQVNTFAAFVLMQKALPSMQRNNFGRIINLSSGWGSFNEGVEGPIAYAASKAALNALTLNAAKQVDGNIKINAMCPGWVHTQMGGKDAPKTPEQGADTAIWLATLDEHGPTGGFFRERKAIKW